MKKIVLFLMLFASVSSQSFAKLGLVFEQPQPSFNAITIELQRLILGALPEALVQFDTQNPALARKVNLDLRSTPQQGRLENSVTLSYREGALDPKPDLNQLAEFLKNHLVNFFMVQAQAYPNIAQMLRLGVDVQGSTLTFTFHEQRPE